MEYVIIKDYIIMYKDKGTELKLYQQPFSSFWLFDFTIYSFTKVILGV